MPWFASRVRHPFYPGFAAARAAAAIGRHTALAGTVEELRRAAVRGARARKAIFILNHNGELWPGREARDELWRLFEVPSYVIRLDAEGRQLGWECEAQEGLHAAGRQRGCPPGFRLETETCACGRPGARLIRACAEEMAPAAPRD